MKVLGRVFLIIAGIFMALNGIPQIIDGIKGLNAVGWQNTFANYNNVAYFVSFVSGIIDVIFAAIAFSGAIRGRKSFGLAFSAIVLMITPVTYIVLGVMGGIALTWIFYVGLGLGFSVPILYFLGFLFI
ncbi:MAG: hypothetical protein K6E59_02500 [Bacilli bacterium]|nr:hypothetical protein [Bacilli bacterium]